MKYTIGEIDRFIMDGYAINKKAYQFCFDLLSDKDEFPSQSIEFDWENGDAPSVSTGAFQDDLTDAYVSKIYVEDDTIKANLHAYYLQRDMDGVDLYPEICTDWLDILDYINTNRK